MAAASGASISQPEHQLALPQETAVGDSKPLGIHIEEALGALVMAVIAVITFANVVIRYTTDLSFAFTEEISVALMVVVTLVGVSLTVANNRHIRVEYFINKAPAHWRPRLLWASMIPVVATMIVLTITGAQVTYDQYKFGVTSSGLDIPQWLYTVWLPILGMAILFRSLMYMRELLKERAS